MFNTLADLTVLVAKSDEVMAGLNSEPEEVTCLQNQVIGTALFVLRDLETWRRRWTSEIRNSYSEAPTVWRHRSKGMELSIRVQSPPKVYTFANLPSAIMPMLYNAALIHVLHILMSFQSKSNAKQEHAAAKLSAALEICRCFPYSSLRASREGSNSSSLN